MRKKVQNILHRDSSPARRVVPSLNRRERIKIEVLFGHFVVSFRLAQFDQRFIARQLGIVFAQPTPSVAKIFLSFTEGPASRILALLAASGNRWRRLRIL